MDDCLYDTSWILYTVSNPTAAYRALISAAPTSLDRRATQLRDFLNTNRPIYDDDSDNEKTGGLRECVWKPLQSDEGSRGISIALVYDKATYRFILHGCSAETPLPLLLAKAPASTTKNFTTFLADTFHATTDPLKLPTSLLQHALQAYLTTLHDDSTSTPTASPLKPTLGTLKLTLTFSAPVAPHLKTLDLDIPPDTVLTFLNTTHNRNGTTRSASGAFLALVAQRLHDLSGLIIPIATHGPRDSNGVDDENDETEDTVMRISKITCAAFAISVDGRLKFANKAVEADAQHEATVRKANEDMLGRILEEAAKRSRNG